MSRGEGEWKRMEKKKKKKIEGDECDEKIL